MPIQPLFIRGSKCFIVIIALFSLLGCTSFSVLDEELPKYTGRHIDSLVEKLGYPNDQTEIMGKTVYIWTNDKTHVSITPTTTTSTGYVGADSVYISSTDYSTSVYNLSCTTRIFVDHNGIIQNAEYNGNNGACYTYSNKLK